MKFVKETMKGLIMNIVAAAVLSSVLTAVAANNKSGSVPQSKLHKIIPQKAYQEEPITECAEIQLPAAETEGVICQLPAIKTNVKFFTDYRSYNLWYTPHFRLQQEAWTDEQGLRRFNEDYQKAHSQSHLLQSNHFRLHPEIPGLLEIGAGSAAAL